MMGGGGVLSREYDVSRGLLIYAIVLPEAKKIGRRHGERWKTGEKGGREGDGGAFGSRSKLIMMCYVCVGVCGSHINPAIS